MPALVQIDCDDLKRLARDIEAVANATPLAIEMRLTRDANKRIEVLKQNTPQQEREDPRHDTKLVNSYSIVRLPGVRQIVTSTPYKYLWVVEGTKPHPIPSQGITLMFWPGIRNPKPHTSYWPGSNIEISGRGGPGVAHPVYHVNHPGTKPNDYVTRAMLAYEMLVGADPDSSVESTVDWAAEGIVRGHLGGI